MVVSIISYPTFLASCEDKSLSNKRTRLNLSATHQAAVNRRYVFQQHHRKYDYIMPGRGNITLWPHERSPGLETRACNYDVCIPESGDEQIGKYIKLSRARSRLYRSRSWQVTIHVAGCFEILLIFRYISIYFGFVLSTL